MTPAQALAVVRRTTKQAEAAMASRDDAIRVALETCTVRQVAEAAGLSPTRIHQIRNHQ